MKIFQSPRSRLDAAYYLRQKASRYPNDGTVEPMVLLEALKVFYVPDRGPVTQMLFSRDVGAHTSGWWKNPDYERCYHLSLSFFDPEIVRAWLTTGDQQLESGSMPRDWKETQAWVELFFSDRTRLLWCEPPTFKTGKTLDVWHYRLFCDEHWQPILPRGEVYTREFTLAGWKSWSDVQAAKAADVEERSQ